MDCSANAAGVLEHSDSGAQKNRVVTEEEWLQKWEMRNIGFHNEQGHPYVTLFSPLNCSEKVCGMNGLSHSRNS